MEIFNALDEKMKELNMPPTIADNTTTAAGGSRDRGAANDGASGGSTGKTSTTTADDVSSGWDAANGAAGEDSVDKTSTTINEKIKK